MGTATAGISAPVAGAQPAPAAASGDTSSLIRAVADASARLDSARESIAVKREDVNKTFVDLQMARVDLDRAIADAERTSAEREDAEDGVDSARSELDEYSRLLHRQGTAPGAASALLDPGGPSDAGLRQEYLQRAAADQRGVVDEMVTAADEAARREAAAAEARLSAEQRYADASARRDAAESEVAAVSDELTALESEVDGLTATLEENERALSESGATPAGPRAVTEPQVDQDATRDAAVRALADAPQSERQAADIASALPTHLDLGTVRQLAGGLDTGSAGDALGDALGGGVDAGSVGDLISAGVDGDNEAIVQQVVDAIGRADFGSVQQGPVAPGQGGNTGGGGVGDTGTPSDSDRVETVVNRALSQLGKPYAWGGGDANGPTRGIRDGGVADAHGDYNKIGFDCSGLMIYAFAGIGKALPHYTGYQYTAGPQYPVSERQRGDMLFWPGHVALYLGDGQMVEAPQSGDVVKISPVRMAGISPMVVRLT